MKEKTVRAAAVLASFMMMLVCGSCGVEDEREPVVMVKNVQTGSYGSGFAAGCEGKDAEYAVTSYSVIGTVNGAAPEYAQIMIRDRADSIYAEVVYCDAEHDIAVLKLPETVEGFEPVALRTGAALADGTEAVAYGFTGTGNVMTERDKLTRYDIEKYGGEVSFAVRADGTDIYSFSNEFNRAAAGGPVISGGSVIGMCAFSLGDESIAQYIVPSGYIQEALDRAGVESLTSAEVRNRRIMLISAAAGAAIALAAVLWSLAGGRSRYAAGLKKLYGTVKERKKSPAGRLYLRVRGGSLDGTVCEITEEESYIGRDPDCIIAYPVNEPGISRFHCSIRRSGGVCVVKDIGSSYGTFLEDGKKLEPEIEHELSAGETFYIAGRSNTVEVTAEGDSKR